GVRPEIYANNDCVAITLEEAIGANDVLDLLRSENVESYLRQSLEGSGFFGARFRECAGAALLITRMRANQRLPLWLSRMRSKSLLDSVKKYDDFPLLLETWRSCLQDEFDMESLELVLGELEQGIIEVTDVRTGVASPFAKSVAWRQINDEYMYNSDKPNADGKTGLREDLLKSFAFNEALRPRVNADLVAAYERKRQRLEIGYAPTDELELKEWLRERVWLRSDEWEVLLEAVGRDGAEFDEGALGFAVREKLWTGEEIVYLEEERDRVYSVAEFGEAAESFLDWLSYFGVVPLSDFQKWYSVEQERLGAFLESLVDAQSLVMGTLLEGSEEVYVCDAENFETLLRMQRTRNKAVFEPLPGASLMPFLAKQQGLIGKAKKGEDLAEVLERFSGLQLKAGLWEEDVLPARLHAYQSSWLDVLMIEEGLCWYSSKQRAIGFAFDDELGDLLNGDGKREGLNEREELVLETVRRGRFSFQGLLSELDISSSELDDVLWSLVWKGTISNDTFASARRGVLADFKSLGDIQAKRVEASSARRARRGRSVRSIGRAIPTYPGNWYALPELSTESDEIEELERQKYRVRILLDRYGVLFRELLQKEETGFQWRDVFKALRLMELSGELLAGRFFEGMMGLQFISHEAFRSLRAGVEKKAIYWHAAVDPVSLCGLGLEVFKGKLPKRLAANRMVWRGEELAMVVSRNGRELQIEVEPDDEDLPEIFEVLRHMLGRRVQAAATIQVEIINGESALRSPYLAALEGSFRMHRDHKRVVLEA
ncbi:MAG: ATP-dependent helicase, partial [Verrucomicrobiota bacterium]